MVCNRQALMILLIVTFLRIVLFLYFTISIEKMSAFFCTYHQFCLISLGICTHFLYIMHISHSFAPMIRTTIFQI
ncbi:hypothetical protein CLOSTASPAR_01771 [[Clostridium] asparagiforme DSM 15981]|uniref:Uncharacterized protein n=1 Tax=[Clostridium] asparagiforme DSM 15981 TaxID=518636 RepID=C0CXP5_9FIRM|nr:hypothetical protein CLOSTASPAR_01771 [[Clostridium] asparagiforme DSM 15981]